MREQRNLQEIANAGNVVRKMKNYRDDNHRWWQASRGGDKSMESRPGLIDLFAT